MQCVGVVSISAIASDTLKFANELKEVRRLNLAESQSAQEDGRFIFALIQKVATNKGHEVFSAEEFTMNRRFFTTFCVVGSALWLPAAAYAEKILTYEELEKIADDLAKEQVVRVNPATFVYYPSDDSPRISYRSTNVLFKPIRDISSFEKRYLNIICLILEAKSEETQFDKAAVLKEAAKKKTLAIKRMVKSLSLRGTEKENDAISVACMSEMQTEFFTSLKDYFKAKGMAFQKANNAVPLDAFLTTDPPGGKICMLSSFEYAFAKVNGNNPDDELGKNVIAKTDPARLAGGYYYMIVWQDGKKSPVAKILISSAGNYILK